MEHVAEAIERYRAGELDVHDVDEVIHRYHKATQDLCKFCYLGGSGAGAESVAATLEHLTAEDRRLFNVLRRRRPRPHLSGTFRRPSFEQTLRPVRAR
jgi:hypothetical protein